MFYVAAYFVTIMYYATMEYRDRFEFFSHIMQLEFHRSYRKLLNRLPNGIILLDKNNSPVFYNRVISKIVAKRSGHTSQHSPDSDDPNTSSDEQKEVFVLAIMYI